MNDDEDESKAQICIYFVNGHWNLVQPHHSILYSSRTESCFHRTRFGIKASIQLWTEKSRQSFPRRFRERKYSGIAVWKRELRNLPLPFKWIRISKNENRHQAVWTQGSFFPLQFDGTDRSFVESTDSAKLCLFCSQFVATVFERAGRPLVQKCPALTKPVDLTNSEQVELYYRGSLHFYLRSPHLHLPDLHHPKSQDRIFQDADVQEMPDPYMFPTAI